MAARSAAWYLRCSLATVRKWSQVPEKTAQLLDGTRPGRRPLFTEALCLRVIAFYCQSPLPGSRGWSVSWAAQYLSKHLEILGRSITSSTIHRILKKHALRPHLVRYFLHVTDPDFFPKMERLIGLYLDPPDHLFCFDECTSIQALERVAATMHTDNGTKIEFEYERHGTRDLFSIFNVPTGKVFGRCTDNHRQETLVDVFAQHVHQQPEDVQLHYICDNLASHSTELFCQKVAALSGLPCPHLKTAPERKEWLQSHEKRIVIHFTPAHGSWLNQVELWFGILKTKCLRGQSFASIDELIQAIIMFHETWNEHFAHPFNWTYTGEGLHEKVVCRVTNWLLLKTKELKPNFLHKQLQLLRNMVRDYWQRVPRRRWACLHQALLDSTDFLAEIIAGDDEIRMDLDELTFSLSGCLEQQPTDAATERSAASGETQSM